MAGDWIRFRSELYTHPRFLALVNGLVYDEQRHGLLVYACGEDALGIGVYPPDEKSVTTRALRCVTERALRDVTMSALLRVWCAINTHCKVIDRNAVMAPMSLIDLDELAGFPDFGSAMLEVGWVEEGGDNSLLFPNFLDFNQPACLRQKPLSNAERQSRHRAKKRQYQVCNESNESNGREEKRREEKKNTPLYSPPSVSTTVSISAFDTFWQHYPRKTNKHAARKAYLKLAPDEALQQTLLDALARWKRSRQWLEGVVPHASTWINGRRWEDELPALDGQSALDAAFAAAKKPGGDSDLF